MATSRHMLKLKLVDPPTDQLEYLAERCRRGTNAAVEDWLLRHRGKQESEKQSKPGRKTKSLHPSTKLYHAITAVVPELGTSIVSTLAGKVWTNLNAKLDWRRRTDDVEAKPRKRADAILAYEDKPPWTTADIIPARNKFTTIVFGDTLRITVTHTLRDDAPLVLDVSLKGMPTGIKHLIHRTATGDQKLSDSEITKKTIRNGKEQCFYFCRWPSNTG